ncbi:hypothetical protein V8C86DRAFT_2707373 [Haematococcus lacustris]
MSGGCFLLLGWLGWRAYGLGLPGPGLPAPPQPPGPPVRRAGGVDSACVRRVCVVARCVDRAWYRFMQQVPSAPFQSTDSPHHTQPRHAGPHLLWSSPWSSAGWLKGSEWKRREPSHSPVHSS